MKTRTQQGRTNSVRDKLLSELVKAEGKKSQMKMGDAREFWKLMIEKSAETYDPSIAWSEVISRLVFDTDQFFLKNKEKIMAERRAKKANMRLKKLRK